MPKPTGRKYRVISADSHVVEAPDLAAFLAIMCHELHARLPRAF